MPLYLLEIPVIDQNHVGHTISETIDAKSDEMAKKKASKICKVRYDDDLKHRPYLKFSDKPKLYKIDPMQFDYPVPMMAKEDMEDILRHIHVNPTTRKLRKAWKKLIKET